MVQSKGYQTRTTRFCGAIPRPIALAIAYEEALAEIELANSFSAANAGPPTSPPEARQRPRHHMNCATNGATAAITVANTSAKTGKTGQVAAHHAQYQELRRACHPHVY
jgi:hypothetical protein